jgi:hypothetical protein
MSLTLTGAGLHRVPAGGGGSVTWAYKTSGSGGGGGASATFSGIAIGTTVSSDIIVLIVSADVGVPTSMTHCPC